MPTRRALLRSGVGLAFLAALAEARPCRAEDLYPRHLDAKTQAAIKRGLLFAFVVIRTLLRAYSTEDVFARFAASGLAILFGVQGAINMAVNLQLIPAKGMTLPFISYGGSSIVSLAYGVGAARSYA
jgi:hypothetical protein